MPSAIRCGLLTRLRRSWQAEGWEKVPGDYPYSSYGHYALGKADALLTPHPIYIGLHANPAARQQAYRSLFHDTLSETLLTRLRDNTNACTVIGNARFKEQIATMLGRAAPTGKRGRPKKSAWKIGKSVRPLYDDLYGQTDPSS